ncbi:hypothetical protein PCANC_09194, partial [Puccinia coronata f. sp. avenae]
MPHAMCTPTIGVHMASRRAEPARLSGGRAKPERPLDRRAGFARLWAHVSLSNREAYVSRGTLIRVPRYPYKDTEGTRTLIRVLCTLIVGLTSASQFERLTLSNREAYVSQPRSVPLELTWARVPKPATNHTNPSPRTELPLNGPTTA